MPFPQVGAGSLIPLQRREIKYLSEEQINRLTEAFQRHFDEAPEGYRKIRGRAWIIYLFNLFVTSVHRSQIGRGSFFVGGLD